MTENDPIVMGTAIDLFKWIVGGLLTVLGFIVKGIIADAKETKIQLAAHEKESASKLGALEAVVKSFDATALRIHERIDEMNTYLRGHK